MHNLMEGITNMTTVSDIKNELTAELAKGVDLDELQENSHERVDGYLPVYNNEIIKEWVDMPGEYDDRGAEEIGTDGDNGIVRLMTLDLYLYYSDLFSQAIKELREVLDKAGR